MPAWFSPATGTRYRTGGIADMLPGMPTRSITTNGAFDPIAVFIVLATMCHPNDLTSRNRMISTIRRGTGVGKVRAGVISDEDFMLEVRRHAKKASKASAIFGDLIQQFNLGMTICKSAAIARIKRGLPAYEQPVGEAYRRALQTGHLPVSYKNDMAAFKAYLPVLPLWCSLVYSLQYPHTSSFPDRIEHLPPFLANAEWFLENGLRMFRAYPIGRVKLVDRAAFWTFPLPDSLRCDSTIAGSLPLPHP